jgi:hypothetical protein
MTETRSIDVAKKHPGAVPDRLAVPWFTVVSLAAVMAYADGFWLISVRGDIGSIDRTQSPFVTWLRESTLTLPVYAFAVLGALTLALHWFGPVLRKPRTVLSTTLMVVVAGTLAGIAVMVASSAYDYSLQSKQLQFMDTVHHHLGHGGVLAAQQQATIAVHVRGVVITSAIILVANLVLVGWAMAFRGGRLAVSATRPALAPPTAAASAADGVHESRVGDLRLLLVAGLLGSAAIHAAVIPQHLTEWGAAGVFFILLAAAELAVAGLLFVRLQPNLLLAAAALSLAPLALWLYSRTLGMPFGPGAGSPEPVGLADLAACALEVLTLLVAVVLLRGIGRLQLRPATSAHVRGLAVVAVVAVTFIGLAGSSLAWFDAVGNSGVQSAVTGSPHSH